MKMEFYTLIFSLGALICSVGYTDFGGQGYHIIAALRRQSLTPSALTK